MSDNSVDSVLLSIFENRVIYSCLILQDFLYSLSFPSDYPEWFVSQPFKCNLSVSELERSFKEAKCFHNLCFYFVLQLPLYDAVFPNVKIILPVERSGSKPSFYHIEQYIIFPTQWLYASLKKFFLLFYHIYIISHIFYAHLKENFVVTIYMSR